MYTLTPVLFVAPLGAGFSSILSAFSSKYTSASLVRRPPLAAFFAAVEKSGSEKKVRGEAWVRGYTSAR